MKFLAISFLVFSLSSAQEVTPGPCPEFTPKTDFITEPYLGKWFEIQRFPSVDEEGQTCNYAEYSDNGDGTVGVHNAGLEADGSYTEIFGYVEPTDVPGALLLHLNGVPFAGDYNVLDTDYETFTSVYSCVGFLGVGHIEQSWVLARNSTPSPETLQRAHDAYNQWGIDISRFTTTVQDPCVFP